MSCIVGLSDGSTVWIGADSAANGGDVTVAYKSPKVFRRGQFLFGVVESFRLRDIVHHDMQVSRRKPGMPDDQYLVQYVVEDIRAACQAADFNLEVFADDEDLEAGALLIGYHGRLWTLDWDYHLGETRDGYAVIGSGAPYALGSLHTSGKPVDITMVGAMDLRHYTQPPQRIRQALEAAAHCSQTVRAPFKILSVR
jgi:hypothetical protein